MEVITLLVGLMIGFLIGSFVKPKIVKQIYDRGLQEGVMMVMPRLDEVRALNLKLTEIMKDGKTIQ